MCCAVRRDGGSFWLSMGLAGFSRSFRGALGALVYRRRADVLPKKIVYPLTSWLRPFSCWPQPRRARGTLCDRCLCAVGWFVVFFALNFASPRFLGFGDVRLSLVLGLSLGWLGFGYVLLGFFAANVIGAVIGIALIATKHLDRQSRIPYGVFLASGCAVAVFAGPELLRPFTNHSI